jgi:coenzyme F420-reducing hydrogenase beta subunit
MVVKASILNVLEYDFCIGCGACTYPQNSPFEIVETEIGTFKAKLKESVSSNDFEDYSLICPFSNESANEDQIGQLLFSQIEGIKQHSKTGYYLDLYAGHVSIEGFRERGSSGGSVSWLIDTLFKLNEIDHVVHVKESNTGNLFEYMISSSSDEARTAAKSKYYPISLADILPIIRDLEGKTLFIGIPCFIKSLRLLSSQYPEISNRIKYTAGLVCGHLKSKFFAYNFAWQLDILPKEITKIDFRHSKPNQSKASLYYVKVNALKNNLPIEKVGLNKSFFGFQWGQGFFKYKACDYCDDVFAETADICFGDAWIKPYVSDPKGDNIVITRNKRLSEIVEDSVKKGDLKFDNVSLEEILKSQDAGLRHRREGTQVRTSVLIKKGLWFPQKRQFEDTMSSTRNQKRIYLFREWMSRQSEVHFKKAIELRDYGYFKRRMRWIVFYYENILYKTKWNKLKRLLRIN